MASSHNDAIAGQARCHVSRCRKVWVIPERFWTKHENTDHWPQLGRRHGNGADLVPVPETAAPRLRDRRAGARVEPADPRTHARSAPGLELPARPRRAGAGHASAHRQVLGRPVRPGDSAAQLLEVGAGAVFLPASPNAPAGAAKCVSACSTTCASWTRLATR